jgi:outer membrane protein assembly factor BamD
LKRSISLVAAGLSLALFLTACHHKKPSKDARNENLTVTPVAQLYEQGLALMKKKKPATARKYFDQIALREDAGDYKDKAAISTADSYYQEHTIEAYGEAISRYQSFLSFHPTHPQAAYCQFMIGQAWFEESDTPDRDMSADLNAKVAYQAVIENYPTSPYAAKAEKRLAQVNDMLAAHDIKIGDWYLKDGHPKGAIARYREVIQHYPKYWNMPALYFRLGEALYRDGQSREALLYFTRITQEAPGTKLAKDAQQRIQRIQKKETARGSHEKDVFKEPLVPKKEKPKREAKETPKKEKKDKKAKGEQPPAPQTQPQDQQPQPQDQQPQPQPQQPPQQQPPPDQPPKQQAS